MPETTAAAQTPADELKELQMEADALAKAQAAAAADAKALQKAFEDGEKEIALYVAEHADLASKTDDAEGDLAAIAHRIQHHSKPTADKVDVVIKDYDKAVDGKQVEYTNAKTAVANAEVALRTAEKDAAEAQADFEKKKGGRERWKAQLANLKKSFAAADAKDDAEHYAEAYAIAAVPLPVRDLPSVEAFANDVRTSRTALSAKRKALRDANNLYVRAVHKRDDLAATIDELTAKRADNILKEVVEKQAEKQHADGAGTPPSGSDADEGLPG